MIITQVSRTGGIDALISAMLHICQLDKNLAQNWLHRPEGVSGNSYRLLEACKACRVALRSLPCACKRVCWWVVGKGGREASPKDVYS